MFERRLKLLLWVLGVAALVIVARLFQLQVVRADYYRRRADRALMLSPKPVPFVRGSILDRRGEVFVSDAPSWDVKIDYAVIAADVEQTPRAVRQKIKRWRRTRRYPRARTDEQIEQAFRSELGRMWRELALFTAGADPVSVSELRACAAEVHARISRIRSAVARRRGFDGPVAEERMPHAILSGLDSQRQVAARDVFGCYPWVHVEPSSRRAFAPGEEPFAHLVGRMGRVDAQAVADDPNADDPFAKYRADELRGLTGVEAVAEQTLRGRRGQITTDRKGKVLDEECVESQRGGDVTLTIHAELQRRLYRLIGQAVRQAPDSCGGVIVVLDVESREVLALVSYPSYDPRRFDDLYPLLRDDTERLPLWFRAVASRYPPGSMVKPLVCLAGLMNKRITLDTREVCTGYLFEDQPDRWRCWKIHGTNQRKAHGSINVVEALTGSCNVFMYRLGEKLGVDRLCGAFDMVGVGRRSGMGLLEEVPGINPTPDWLMLHKGRSVTPGTARLFAIGQGEIAMTPVQVANLMAVYASGKFRPLTLIRHGPETPEWTLPARPEDMLAIRRGMYGVVNDPEGTAYKYARFEHDRYVICGKTGSATAHPRPTSYRIPYVDEHGDAIVTVVPAGAMGPAIERFETEHPAATFDPSGIEVAGHWPPDPAADGEYSHAWFGGFLQRTGPDGRPDWTVTPRIAFAVLIEFGGSGGRVSGPLAKEVAAELLAVFGPELQTGGDPWGVRRR